MKKTYKQLQEELDQILSHFEQSTHEDVDELLADYDKGKKIIKELEAHLDSAELTIQKAKKA